VDPAQPFGDAEKRAFAEDRAARKPRFGDPGVPGALERDAEGFVFLLAPSPAAGDDKSLALCRRMMSQGFSDALSSRFPIVVAHAEPTGVDSVECGRHRIAALKYLRRYRGGPNRTVTCHRVRHPYESLVYTRPYADACRQCLQETAG
jgi:hypothetical protein